MERIDCNNTLNFFKETKRMCESLTCCSSCPLDCIDEYGCDLDQITQEHIERVQKWSDKHPQREMEGK